MQLKDKKIMPPLWLAFPELERHSIGWRMGYGEGYRYRLGDWMKALSEEERKEYQELFPEPVTWKGWWEKEDTCEVLAQGDFRMPLWRPEGIPKYTRFWLTQEAAYDKQHVFCLFWGHRPSRDGSITQSCLSQWWMGEFRSVARKYCCMEQFMMEKKAQLFGDETIRKQILEGQTPDQFKALGRKVQGFDQELWDRAKYSIVLNGNWCKFSQDRRLKAFFFSSGDSILVEASPYDTIWGIGLSADSPDARNPWKWRGQNLLGFALMEVRDELRRVTQNEGLCDWSLAER